MSIRNQLAGGGSGVSIIDDITITTSQNWTKAALVLPTDKVKVLMTGAGAGGGKGGASTYGGFGGSFAELEFFAYELGSPIPVVIGAGGAGSTVNGNGGGDGGNTSFNGIIVPGGKNNSSATVAPDAVDLSDGTFGLGVLQRSLLSGFQIGSFYLSPNVIRVEAAFAKATPDLVGRRTRAGGYGGQYNGSNVVVPPGISLNGGNGGTATVGANGGNGLAPGGGGGAGASAGTKGGDGARGEVRVIVMRGKS